MRRSRLTTILVIVSFTIGAAIVTVPIFAPSCTLVSGIDTVAASLDGLNPGAARFFCYRDRTGREIQFVLARAADGTVQAVFDACKQCYRYHKGYDVAGGYLICRLCGNRYRLEQAQTGLASCQPVHLESSPRGNVVEVKIAELEKGQALF